MIHGFHNFPSCLISLLEQLTEPWIIVKVIEKGTDEGMHEVRQVGRGAELHAFSGWDILQEINYQTHSFGF